MAKEFKYIDSSEQKHRFRYLFDWYIENIDRDLMSFFITWTHTNKRFNSSVEFK